MGVPAERSDRKETMRLLLLSLIVTLVASQSSDRLEPPPGQRCSGRNCKGDLVCGSNNCKKFGAYYHEKDDCCERATSPIKKSPEFDRTEKQGWGPWSAWSPCSHSCGAVRKSRSRQCIGNCKNHHLFENQERICVNPDCNFL